MSVTFRQITATEEIAKALSRLMQTAVHARRVGYTCCRVDYMGVTDSVYVSVNGDQPRQPLLSRQIQIGNRPTCDVVDDLNKARKDMEQWI